MSKTSRPGVSVSRPVAAGVVLAAAGGAALMASMLTSYLVADHSSSDSSPSALAAIGLGFAGALALALSAVWLSAVGLTRLWRRRRAHRQA